MPGLADSPTAIEAGFSSIAEDAPVIIWVTDPSGWCVYLNRRWFERTGQPVREGLGYGWINASHPDDRAMAEDTFRSANAQKTEFRFEYRLQRTDGTYGWAIDIGTPRFDAGGNFLGYVGSVVDIDERKIAEERLAYNEEQLRLAVDAAEVGLWDVDPINDRLFWPARVKAMFGISADAPVSMADFYTGLHPDDRESVGAAYAKAADPLVRGLYDVEYRTVGKEDGKQRWVAAKGRGIFDKDGRCVRVIGTAIDISKRKQTERNQALLIAELNHRAKNLLAIIQSIAFQTFKGGDSVEASREEFDLRLQALAGAHKLISERSWDDVDLHSFVTSPLSALGLDRPQVIVEGPPLSVRPKTGVSIAMAVHELATNAMKYGSLSVPGGRVEVRWELDPEELTLIWRESGGPEVRPPGNKGFGSRMIERGLASELNGSVKIEYDPRGVLCTVRAPIPTIAESGDEVPFTHGV